MSEVANTARQEFWRPPAPAEVTGAVRPDSCDECGAEFMVGSRYCHSCGGQRADSSATQAIEIPVVTEFTALGKRLGLATPSLIAFVFGAFCLIAALSIGVLFTARTALDWQAIQLWRIEWLLAAIAGFAAGLLLKKAS